MIHSKYLQDGMLSDRKPKGRLDARRKPVGIDRDELIEILQGAGFLLLAIADVLLLLFLI